MVISSEDDEASDTAADYSDDSEADDSKLIPLLSEIICCIKWIMIFQWCVNITDVRNKYTKYFLSRPDAVVYPFSLITSNDFSRLWYIAAQPEQANLANSINGMTLNAEFKK